jgi:cytochrome c
VQKRGGKWLWISGGEEKVVTDGMRAGRYRFRLGDTVMDWMDGFGPRPLHLGSEPFAYTRESAEIGAAVYAEMGCASCHGKEGRGDGSSADESRGSLGQRVLPNDYTKGNFKGGADAASLVQSFLTGLHGTPMPSFHESFRGVRSAAPDTAPWHLAHFIQRQAGVPYPGDE